jgi:hypothetical protein
LDLHAVDWERLTERLEDFGGCCDYKVVMNCDPDEVLR